MAIATASPGAAARPAPANACGPARGSAPAILRDLAPQLATMSGGAVMLPGPYGPPQGRLDPAFAAFLDGRSDFALLTRELDEGDLATFRAHHRGRSPQVIPVAAGNWNRFGYVDAVAVIVNRANPLRAMSLAELDAVFSATRLRGHAAVTRWRDLGVRGPLADRPVRLVGTGAWTGDESARGLTMRRHVLSVGSRTGRWRTVADGGAEATVVEDVGRDVAAIGFTGMGHLSSEVRALAIDGVAPTAASARSGRYPLLRTVDLLVDAPGGRIDARVLGFVRALHTARGQRLIADQGDVAALPAAALVSARRRVAGFRRSPACSAGDG